MGVPVKLVYNDQQHAYRLDGKRCKSVTAVAKIPDDTYNLSQWQKRQVAIGLAAAPEMLEEVAAHFDDKEAINAVCEKALAAAKAHSAADRGTAWHRITERVDLAEEMIETPQSRAIAVAWQRALDMAGLEVLPEYVERIVVYPDLLLCGKFDRIMRRKADGRYVIVDLKTGENAVRYPHSIAIQEAIYANAPLLAGPIGGQSGSTETFTELPEPFDRTLGYVVHMPDTDHVEVVGVDIEAGWAIARDVCFPVVEWRKRSDLTFPLPAVTVNEGNINDGDTSSGPDRVPGRPDDVAGEGEPKPAKASRTRKKAADVEPSVTEAEPVDHGRSEGGHDAGVSGAARPEPAGGANSDDAEARKAERKRARVAVEQPGTDENHAVPAEHRFAWLRARLETIRENEQAFNMAASGWPDDTPTLKTFRHDDDGLDRIAVLLGRIESKFDIPFGPGLRSYMPAEDSPAAVDVDPAVAVAAQFPGAVVTVDDEGKRPYVNWLRQIVANHPAAGDTIVADLKNVGLQKSLSRDEWTPDELKTLDGILRRAERAASTNPGAANQQQQIAS